MQDIKKEIFQIYKPKDAQSQKIEMLLSKHLKDIDSMEAFSKRSPMAENVIRKLYPDMNSMFNKKLKTPKDGAKVIHQIIELTNTSLKNYKIDIKLESKAAVTLFYEIYGYMIKLLMTMNVASAAVVWGPTVVIGLTLFITCAVLYNATVHNVSPKQAWTNFKKSFLEFLKRKVPTKAERNLAIMPLIILSAIAISLSFLMAGGGITAIIYATLKIGWGTWLLSTAGGLGALGGAAAAFFLGWYLKGALFFYITEVVEEWVLRKGQGNPQEV